MPSKKTSINKKPKNSMYYNGKLVHSFLFALLLVLAVVVLWMFRPFILEIVLAGVIVSFFYPLYKIILRVVKSSALASVITTIVVAAIIIIPLVEFSAYFVNRTIDAYNSLSPYVQNEEFINNVIATVDDGLRFVNLDTVKLAGVLTDIAVKVNSFILIASRNILVGTTNLIVSILIIFLTMFYLFVDGKKLSRRVMNLTPLPNKYDAQIFNTFREVSYSAIVSTILVAIFQGLLGGIAFLIIGLPGFFAGVMMGGLSVVPYIGPATIWFPTSLYLLIQGDIVRGIILFAFGLVISLGDNVLRAKLIKGRAQVHEMIIFFALIGGLLVFGFWGIILGPLLVALLFTVIDIYEKEFASQLEIDVD